MAIKENGDIFYKCSFEKVNSSTFESFIKSLPWSNHTLILDNASIHKTKNVTNALIEKDNKALFIAPYTPECNPIENVFSVIKSHFRKLIVKDPFIDYENAITQIVKILNTTALFKAAFENTRKFLKRI